MKMEKAAEFFIQISNVKQFKIGFIILKTVSCKIKNKAISIGGLQGL
jgi:hypothetical protein